MVKVCWVHVQVERVERFVVAHGQIVLNQFKNFPNKAVARSAFAATLRERMETRRHAKLYLAPLGRGQRAKGLRANPLRDRAAGRGKPMTATATTMVKAIWQSYFLAPGQAGAAVLLSLGPSASTVTWC